MRTDLSAMVSAEATVQPFEGTLPNRIGASTQPV